MIYPECGQDYIQSQSYPHLVGTFFGECLWNYITFNEAVVGSNPTAGKSGPA
ncbi:MAG: hypothetical protein HYZ45_14785 [Burkholderiales bacterium]|nr:hypothetical protein [Burkholderiales bacterium]